MSGSDVGLQLDLAALSSLMMKLGAAGLKTSAQAGVDFHTLLCMGEIAETCPACPEYRREINLCRQRQRSKPIWLYKAVETGTASNFVADELLKKGQERTSHRSCLLYCQFCLRAIAICSSLNCSMRARSVLTRPLDMVSSKLCTIQYCLWHAKQHSMTRFINIITGLGTFDHPRSRSCLQEFPTSKPLFSLSFSLGDLLRTQDVSYLSTDGKGLAG